MNLSHQIECIERLPKAIRDAGISMIERKLATGTVTDLVAISDTDWHQACRRFNAIQQLAEHPGRLRRRAWATSVPDRGGVPTSGAVAPS
jgi:hypothetical protein